MPANAAVLGNVVGDVQDIGTCGTTFCGLLKKIIKAPAALNKPMLKLAHLKSEEEEYHFVEGCPFT